MEQTQLSIELGKSFDQLTFVREREKAERLVEKGWQPVWEPKAKAGEFELPNYSNYFILVLDTRHDKSDQPSSMKKGTREIFEGMSFKYPPVSKEDYDNAYEEYVRRCSFQ